MITPLQPPRLSPNVLAVLRQRYVAKNERGIPVKSPATCSTAWPKTWHRPIPLHARLILFPCTILLSLHPYRNVLCWIFVQIWQPIGLVIS